MALVVLYALGAWVSPTSILLLIGPLVGFGAGVLVGCAVTWRPQVLTPEQRDYDIMIASFDEAMEAAGDWCQDGEGPAGAIRRLRSLIEQRNGHSHGSHRDPH